MEFNIIGYTAYDKSLNFHQKKKQNIVAKKP